VVFARFHCLEGWRSSRRDWRLEAAFTGEPADQIVTATALVRGSTLVTSDRAILAWAGRNRAPEVVDAKS